MNCASISSCTYSTLHPRLASAVLAYSAHITKPSSELSVPIDDITVRVETYNGKRTHVQFIHSTGRYSLLMRRRGRPILMNYDRDGNLQGLAKADNVIERMLSILQG